MHFRETLHFYHLVQSSNFVTNCYSINSDRFNLETLVKKVKKLKLITVGVLIEILSGQTIMTGHNNRIITTTTTTTTTTKQKKKPST
jgi:hypothetical protein